MSDLDDCITFDIRSTLVIAQELRDELGKRITYGNAEDREVSLYYALLDFLEDDGE